MTEIGLKYSGTPLFNGLDPCMISGLLSMQSSHQTQNTNKYISQFQLSKHFTKIHIHTFQNYLTV